MKYLVTFGVSLVVGLFALVLTPTATADHCATPRVTYRAPYVAPSYHVPTYVAPTYHAPVTYNHTPVVKKVVNYDYKKDDAYYLKFVAVVPLVELPTYSAVYTPPYAPVQAPPNRQSNEDLKKVLDAIKELGVRVRALEGRTTPAPTAPTTTPPVGSAAPATTPPTIPDVKLVNKNKCALCHERGSEASGGGFVLSEKDGTIVRMTSEQLAELDEQIYANKMPKLNAKAKAKGITSLNDLEYAAFRNEITRQRALNKKE